MKKLLPLVTFICILGSCGSNRNDLMTKLINEKKLVGDSIEIYRSKMLDFKTQIELSIYNPDSTLFKKLDDSAYFYGLSSDRARYRVAKLDFSIDSLSKMK